MTVRHLGTALGCLLLVACGTDVPAARNDVTAPPATTEPAPAPTVVQRPLSRRDVLLAVADAASRFSAGTDNGSEQQTLEGRPFAFRIRLCGSLNDDFTTSFDEEERVLRVAVRPNLDAKSLSARGFVAAGNQAVEGFWIPRPWLLEAACPAALPVDAADSEEKTATASPWVGIAQFSNDDRARSITRDGRAYEVTRKLPDGSSSEPVDLVLEGRLQNSPQGRIITCAGDAARQPPTCIVSVRLDTVRLEQAGGERLAEWSEG